MAKPNRQVFTSGLWVVATPIGNLGDLTQRARWILEDAEVFFCEDTRRVRALFSALEIPAGGKRLERMDQHSSLHQITKWVQEFLFTKPCVLISDAGTPGVSDPGALLIQCAIENQIPVMPIPGPSAVTALISVSGFSEPDFCFRGFFPKTEIQRRESIAQLASGLVSIWFDSPLRIQRSLELISQVLPEARLVVAKELTKIHEKIFRGPVGEVAADVSRELQKEGSRGEWCFAAKVSKPSENNMSHGGESVHWKRCLSCLVRAGSSLSEGAALVGHEYGVSRREIYAWGLLYLKKKEDEGVDPF